MRFLVAFAIFAMAFNTVRADEKEEMAKLTVAGLSKAVEAFKKKNGKYPEKLQVIYDAGYIDPKALVDGKLLDPWENEYKYDAKGKKNEGKKADIWAETPDKKLIGNWPEKEEKK